MIDRDRFRTLVQSQAEVSDSKYNGILGYALKMRKKSIGSHIIKVFKNVENFWRTEKNFGSGPHAQKIFEEKNGVSESETCKNEDKIQKILVSPARSAENLFAFSLSKPLENEPSQR
uniref:Uncharacterized protein n=1 Tax=Romanomermis culicivorax TaxID=13658 RepID=A0A915KV41_ROMCU